MVSTIVPLVQAARTTWVRSVVAFVAASTIAGGVFGALLGGLGSVLLGGAPASPAALALTALAAALVDLKVIPVRLPFCQRSVPQSWWVRLGPTRGALAYGATLGIGVTTVIPVAAFYFVLLVASATGPAYGAFVLGLYGLGRSLPVVLVSVASLLGVPVFAITEWAIRRDRTAQLVCAALLIFASLGLFVSGETIAKVF